MPRLILGVDAKKVIPLLSLLTDRRQTVVGGVTASKMSRTGFAS